MVCTLVPVFFARPPIVDKQVSPISTTLVASYRWPRKAYSGVCADLPCRKRRNSSTRFLKRQQFYSNQANHQSANDRGPYSTSCMAEMTPSGERLRCSGHRAKLTDFSMGVGPVGEGKPFDCRAPPRRVAPAVKQQPDAFDAKAQIAGPCTRSAAYKPPAPNTRYPASARTADGARPVPSK